MVNYVVNDEGHVKVHFPHPHGKDMLFFQLSKALFSYPLRTFCVQFLHQTLLMVNLTKFQLFSYFVKQISFRYTFVFHLTKKISGKENFSLNKFL